MSHRNKTFALQQYWSQVSTNSCAGRAAIEQKKQMAGLRDTSVSVSHDACSTRDQILQKCGTQMTRLQDASDWELLLPLPWRMWRFQYPGTGFQQLPRHRP
jgi:hypothetical protein